MSTLDVVLDELLTTAIAERRVVVGLAGPVAVGKTTIASSIAEGLRGRGSSVRVLTTDSFLFPNEELAVRDLLMRKGFPETYDVHAIRSTLRRLKEGESVDVPVYSHVTYDIVRNQTLAVDPADVVVVEGVIALQQAVRPELDLGVYVDAPEEIVRGWFIERFLRLTEAARDDEASFYHRFAQLPDDHLRQLAEGTWDGINAPNLREHIAPSKANADLVVTKGADHTIVDVARV